MRSSAILKAEKQGLTYTGISWADYDTKRAEACKNRVKEIKAKYKVRAIIVKESNGWSSYYGDKNFCMVQYDSVERIDNKLAELPDLRAKAKAEYEKELARLDKIEADQKELRKKILEISK